MSKDLNHDESLPGTSAAKNVFGGGDEGEWYADGLRFECTQCGNCCTGAPGYVWFDDDEAQEMADFVGVDKREFYQRYTKRKMGKWTLDEVRYERSKYDCVFLERDENGRGKCSIYEVRPTQCRTWPFWASNLASPREWAESAKGCPGMKLPDDPKAGGQFVPIEKIRIELAKNPDGL